MSNSKQYTDEFRAMAVKQVIERGFTVVDVASRIGIPKHTVRLGAGSQEDDARLQRNGRAERLDRDPPALGRSAAGDR